jgi:uncharacterized protein
MNRKVNLDRRSMIQASLAFLGLSTTVGCSHLSNSQPETSQVGAFSTQKRNRDAVEAYFTALETGKFEVLKEIFAADAKQVMPYAFGNFPRSFDGREGIYKQYSSLPKTFSKMSFPRTIFLTENPDLVFVQFRGDIEIRKGGRYQNDYVGIFRFENGLIKEYTEYFNPILVSKAFNVPIS